MANRLTIEIYGTRYSITSTEDPAYVEALAREADKQLTNLMLTSKASLNQALILMCLHYLDANKKSEESADRLRGEVTGYLNDAQDARAELSAALQRLERFEKTERPLESAGKKR